MERSFSVKVKVEELEILLGPEDVDVDFRRILKEARDERRRKIFDTFSSDDLSLLVAQWSSTKEHHGDKIRRICKRWMVASMGQTEEQTIVGWSQDEKRVIDAVEDFLERCGQVIVDIEVVESLLRPENLEVSLRYILKHATSRGSNIFQLFDTVEKPNHFVASRERWLDSQGSGNISVL